MRKTWKRIVSVMMALAMVVLCLPGYSNPVKTAKAAAAETITTTMDNNGNVTYYDASGAKHTISRSEYTLVSTDAGRNSDSITTWNTGTYVIASSNTPNNNNISTVKISGRIAINGEVKIIVLDSVRVRRNNGQYVNAKNYLSVSAGINVPSGSSLTIYGSQDENTAGRITVSVTGRNNSGAAGIGGRNNSSCGTITIEGGYVSGTGYGGAAGIGAGQGGTAGKVFIKGGYVKGTGGNGSSNANGGAGIGGGNTEVTITDGKISATGNGGGAGIGGSYNVAGGTITISGGDIEATGSYGGAGIGGGRDGAGGTISIAGGKITATGSTYDFSTIMTRNYGGGAGIGGGSHGNGGSITISGGSVTATGGDYAAGVGGGYHAYGGNISISGASTRVTATGGFFAAGIGGGCSVENGISTTQSINIAGGTVTAIGGEGGCGIGSGETQDTVGSITISGGTVNATAGPYDADYEDYYTAAIGGTFSGSDKITISGGNVTTHLPSSNNRYVTGIGAIRNGGHSNVEITGGVIVANGTTGTYAGAGIGDTNSGNGSKVSISITNNNDSVTANNYGNATVTLVTPVKDVTSSPNVDLDAGVVTNHSKINGRKLVKATTYTIEFVNADTEHTPLQDPIEVTPGTHPKYSGATPTLPATAQYTYTFSGWKDENNQTYGKDEELPAANGSMTYTATYTATVNEYTVTFVTENGSEISSETYPYNTAADNIAVPTAPEKDPSTEETFEFKGWLNTTTNAIGVVAVTGDVTYKATYNGSPRKYTVTFVDENGVNIIDPVEYEYNTAANAITVPEAPTKDPSTEETFAFTGWKNTTTNEIGVVAVTGDATYKATYTGSPRKYTVTFKDANGNNIIDPAQYDYNTPADEITVPEAPFKDADDEFVYTFSGWSPAITAVTGDATYVATYSTSPRQYSDLEVKAVWDDNGDCDGFRPDSVTVTLLGNEETVSTKTLSGDTWTDTFHVPTNDVKGNPITYTIEAPSFDNYEKTVNGFTVTYKHTPETTEASVKVVWVDSNDEFSTRPNDLEVSLSNGAKVTLNSDNSWTATVSGLLKHENQGEVINYTWPEFSVPGYKLTNTTTEGTTTTFTFTLITTTVSGEVLWELKDNSVDLLPENVTVYIKDGDTTVDTITVSANTVGEWAFTSIELPKFRADGTGTTEISYTVSEAAVPRFTTTISGTEITNTLNTCDVTVSISWDDADNQDGYRPNEDGVAVTLIGDSVEVDTIVLNAENGWTHTWTDVPKESDSDTDIQYTVEGATVSEYTFEGSSLVDGNDPRNIVLNYQHIPETTGVQVTVVWNDNNNQDGYRLDDVTINLFSGGEQIDTVMLNEGNSWSKTWTGLDKKISGHSIKYTVIVEEDSIPEYSVAIAKAEGDDFKYTVTLNHEIEKTNVKVSKVWDDADDQDGYRPYDVTIRLLADDDEKEAVTLNEENNWTYTWSDLDKKADGNDIDYMVTEDEVENYNAQITKATDGTFTYTVTNTHKPEETEVKVSKVWSDADDQDGYRPDLVTINLLADDEVIKTVQLNEENNWSYNWTKLPKKADGIDIDYTVTEDDVDKYTKDIVKATDGTFTYTVTNTHETEETEVSVIKVWDDADDQDGYRPDDVTVNLLADGNIIDTVTLSAENEWSYSWTKLDKKAAGKEIVYTVSEDTVANYTPSIEQDADGSFTYTVTNKHTTEKVDVTVSKVWEDSNDLEGFRPESVTVHLYSGSKMINTAVLGSTNNWKFTFEGLEKNANGVAIDYKVTEDPVANYSTEITKATDGTFTYTVTNSRTVEYTQVSVEKIWDDSDNKEGFRPESVTVKLLANGEEAGTATLNADNEWKYTWTDLQKYVGGQEVTFTVSEDQLANYKTPVIEKVSETEWSYTVTNSRDYEETEASVSVVWDDNDNEEGFRPDSVTVNLMKGNAVLESVELNEGNGWSHSWTKLQKYENGEAVDYTVTEDPVANYSTLITKADGTFTYTVTNSRTTEKTLVSVEKIWDDSDNKEGFRPESVTVKLLANGEEAGTATLDEDNEWKYTWSDLNKYANGAEIIYTVSEDQLANYKTPVIEKVSETAWAYTVTNSRDYEETEVKFSIVWNDANDQDGYRPSNVTVRLLADGESTADSFVLDSSNWNGTFDQLQKIANATEINYTISVDDISEYTTKIEQAADGTFTYTVTYSHTIEQTEVSVSKVWNDADDQDGYRPDDVTVNLLADGKIIDTVTLSEENEWSYSWTKLDKKAAGKDIDYTVTEDEVSEYTTKIDKADDGTFTYTVTNTHKTEETEVKVKKVWNDADDQDGYRPDDVTVNLLADGEVIDTVKLSDENNWSYGWIKLDKKAAGKDIDYTVTEDEVAEYTTNIEKTSEDSFSYTITNSHTTEETEVDVLKVWDDADDQDGYRPDDVTVNLLADGKIIDTVTLSEENEWSYSWTKLDKKANGADIDYTVTENAIEEYTTRIVKTDENAFSYTVTNSHTPEETESTIKIVWNLDAKEVKTLPEDFEGVRPEHYADDQVADLALLLNSDNDWTYTECNLKKNKNHGVAIEYRWTLGTTVLPEGFEATSSVEGTTTTITITYVAKETKLPLEVTKVLTGRKWNEDDSFEFTLAADENNQDGATLPEKTVRNATVDSKTVAFDDIVFSTYGTYKFTITETKGNIPGVTYDTEEKEFTVVIKDDGKGTLYVDSATNDGIVEIKNPYESTGEFTFTATKVLNGRDLTEGEFTFALKDEDGNVLQTASNKVDGTIKFEPITYTEEDMVVEGKIVTARIYTYTINEVKPEGDEVDDKIVYDNSVKTITVTLTDNQKGSITAEPDVTNITFTNEKIPEVYEIKFVDEDGTLLKSEKYTEGTKAADIKTPEAPTKAADDKYTYEFESWTPAIADVTADATYTAKYKATEIKKDPVKGVYKYIGEAAKYTKGSKKAVTIIFKRTENDEITFDMFAGVKTAKGNLVSGTHYTAKKGSVEITLLPDYLETLEVGKTAITVSFQDGDPVTIELEVAPAQQQADTNPTTGDSLNMNYIWIICVIGAAALAIVLFVQIRRRREEEF